MISLSIIDDEPKTIDFFRRTTLNSSNAVCVKTSSTITEYLSSTIEIKSKHFIFLDIHLKNKSSIQDIPQLLKHNPSSEVIIYSIDEQFDQLLNAFKLGASGYIVKSYNECSLKSFFNILDQDGAAISPLMARKLIAKIRGEESKEKSSIKISTTEKQILSLLSQGWTYEYIADEMDITVNGIRYHIKKIYRKLGVNSRAEATNIFRNLF